MSFTVCPVFLTVWNIFLWLIPLIYGMNSSGMLYFCLIHKQYITTCCNTMESRSELCANLGIICLPCQMFWCLRYNITATWGDWSSWQDCSTTCDSGTQIRVKECLDPKSTGISCDGKQPSENKYCSDGQCRKCLLTRYIFSGVIFQLVIITYEST